MIDAKQRPFQVMGILNVTPDSFFDGGRHFSNDGAAASLQLAMRHAEKMVGDGAGIIDVGGESTRPGAAVVPAAEERARVVPVIAALRRLFPHLVISIDSRKSEVAEAALDVGANMVNDVGGFTDEKMIALLTRYPCEAVMMHMRGTPQTMQQNPTYSDVVGEVAAFFSDRLRHLEERQINRQRLIIDPGIGFGKTVEHNLLLLQRLPELAGLGQRLLIGASRKSFIGNILDLPEVERRLEGSLAAAVVAFMNGAEIFRVHDVKETMRALRIAAAITNVRVKI